MGILAINGGKPVSKDRYKVKWPEVGQDDIRSIVRVVESGQWWRYTTTRESEVSLFEKEYAHYHDAKYCLSVFNGTVAIVAALKALGIEAGDEVIVPSLTFIASASAIILAQGVPIFADVLEDTCQIDPVSIEKKITRRTKGIVVVHYGGYPADMDAILKIAKRHRLFVVEDSAHAQGTEWKGRKVGAIGDIGTFSFQQSKSLTSGEGGAIITNSKELYEKVYAYHHIGRAHGSAKYDHTIVGPNYRITEFQGALLRTQLKKLQRQTEKRMENANLLSKGLKEIEGIKPLKEDKRITQRGYYFYILRYDEKAFGGLSRENLLKALSAEGTPLGVGYRMPVYQSPVFQKSHFGRTGCPISCEKYKGKIDYSKVRCPAAEKISYKQLLTLDTHILLQKSNITNLLKALKKIQKHQKEFK
jgi:dTDP-4-amino-4,6-dideoxygalactose transaminase